MTMIGIADEKETEEDRPSTAPPSPSPPPPLPPPPPPKTTIGVADENKAEEDRPSTAPVSPSPRTPPPPPPMATIGVADEKEAEEDRLSTARPSPPPPTLASPRQAPASPPPVLPLSMDEEGDAAGWRQDKVGLRLPVKTPRSIRGPPATSAPTISACAPVLAQLLNPAGDTDGYLLDAHRDKRSDKSWARPTHAVSPSSSDSEDGSTASDSSAYEDGPLDGVGMQLPANVFRKWAAKEAPQLLQYPQTTDADAFLTLEDEEDTGLPLVNGHEAKGGHLCQLTACKSDARDDELIACEDDQELMDKPTCDMASHDQSKESINIHITESLEVEVISRKLVKSTNIFGKMVVHFAPPGDVEHSMVFMVSKLSEINYTSYPRVDRELFKKIPVLSSKRFPDFFELLKWRRKNGYLPLPFEVTAEAIEDPHTKDHVKGVSMYFVLISCLPTGLTDIRDVVVKIPFPPVDHIGIERKTRNHIWKSVGTHEELEHSIEWRIPYIGSSDKSAYMQVDAYCYDGWQEPSQFFPITIDFSYDQSIGSEVSRVVRSEDGLVVEFEQDTVARCKYTVHHPNELARRAAEASEEEVAWRLAPWAPWEDEGVEDDFV